MAAQKASIELLPQEEWQKGKLGKLLKWTLTVGRHIVILTELVVILAFLSRFKLDRDLADLGKEIKQKQAIIEASTDFEQEFRFLQKRLASIESLRKDQVHAVEIVSELATLTPLNIQFSDLEVDEKSIGLTATSLTESGLATLLNKLKNSDRFEKLLLTGVSQDTEKQAGIKLQLKNSVLSEAKQVKLEEEQVNLEKE